MTSLGPRVVADVISYDEVILGGLSPSSSMTAVLTRTQPCEGTTRGEAMWWRRQGAKECWRLAATARSWEGRGRTSLRVSEGGWPRRHPDRRHVKLSCVQNSKRYLSVVFSRVAWCSAWQPWGVDPLHAHSVPYEARVLLVVGKSPVASRPS